MVKTVTYSLIYKKLDEKVTLDNFSSVNDAITYCQKYSITDPLEISRIEKIEEKVLSRFELVKILGLPE